MTIAANAGIDGAIVIGKLIEQEDLSLGYDAAKGLFFLTMNILNCVAPTSTIFCHVHHHCQDTPKGSIQISKAA
jgi:chaperonin GroEL (HSP60 family)